ncbi:MAG: hypothetical protein ACOYPR_08060 [Saprospiraceae bacterium]|jgi:hypothetical protein
MEPNPQEQTPLLDCQQRLAALEKAFSSSEHRTHRLMQDNNALQQELHQLQHDYESLRLQKGGFGFKALLGSGFLATLMAIAFWYFVFRPSKDLHAHLFEHFQKEHQFNIEYAISQGQFKHAEDLLKASLEQPENAPIYPEIQMVYKIVGASKRKCE